MSDIDVKLSESGMDTPGFHDYQYYYPATNSGSNGDELVLTLENRSGNFFSVVLYDEGDRKIISRDQDVSKISIVIDGGIEHTDFFNMLKLIKEAHEVGGALGGKHGEYS
jgi:hypothetical protein